MLLIECCGDVIGLSHVLDESWKCFFSSRFSCSQRHLDMNTNHHAKSHSALCRWLLFTCWVNESRKAKSSQFRLWEFDLFLWWWVATWNRTREWTLKWEISRKLPLNFSMSKKKIIRILSHYNFRRNFFSLKFENIQKWISDCQITLKRISKIEFKFILELFRVKSSFFLLNKIYGSRLSRKVNRDIYATDYRVLNSLFLLSHVHRSQKKWTRPMKNQISERWRERLWKISGINLTIIYEWYFSKTEHSETSSGVA